MSERTSYEPGTPCWVDLGSPDLDASVEFYGGLFGWEVPEAENAEQTGGYRPGDEERQAGRRDDAADAGGPAARLDAPTSRSPTPTRPRRRSRRPAAACSPSRWT